jgi:hypothetical protein
VVKRALIETAAVLVCAALGVGLGRSYDPKIMSWAVYLGLVFASAAVLLFVLVRLERFFDPDPSTTTGRSREAARVQDPYEDQARGVKR